MTALTACASTVAATAPTTPNRTRKDKQQVEPDIQHGGKQQKDERRCRIIQTAQNGADQIVIELRKDPDKNDQRILIGRPPDAGVCLGQTVEPEQGLERPYGDAGQRASDKTPPRTSCTAKDLWTLA